MVYASGDNRFMVSIAHRLDNIVCWKFNLYCRTMAGRLYSFTNVAITLSHEQTGICSCFLSLKLIEIIYKSVGHSLYFLDARRTQRWTDLTAELLEYSIIYLMREQFWDTRRTELKVVKFFEEDWEKRWMGGSDKIKVVKSSVVVMYGSSPWKLSSFLSFLHYELVVSLYISLLLYFSQCIQSCMQSLSILVVVWQ